MNHTTRPSPAPAVYRRGLAVFATIAAAWVFVLVALGAFTTSIGAGMAFTDWPLSNGSLNPHGWLHHISMFAEHSHRLSGTTMGILTIILAVWLWKRESRSWLRKFGVWALIVVVVQGLLGGSRVMLDRVHVPGFEMTLGQMLRIPHGILAQVFVCMLIAIAASCTRAWITRPSPAAGRVRVLGTICVCLLFVQLTIAAVMRHNNAGLAIPTFPWSTADHRLLPVVWNFPVIINFCHRTMAAILAVALIWFVVLVWRDPGCSAPMKTVALLLVGLLVLQILLGAGIVWTHRSPEITTAHVLTGALTLATAFWLNWQAHRDLIEGSAHP